MERGRRLQRSVRVTTAVLLLAVATVLVAVSVATSTWVSAAAVYALVTALVAARILWTEVRQTRRAWACDRADQAREFTEVMTRTRSEHAEFLDLLEARVRVRDRAIHELNGTLALAEARADSAEARVLREARRANDAQERLAALLSEVLGGPEEHAPSAEDETGADLPTVVDLLAWEERTDAALAAKHETAGTLPREA